MKLGLLFAVASISLAAPLRSEVPLAAHELAHHLGVTSWVSQIRLEGTDHALQILRIVNGEITDALLSSPAFTTNRESTRVAILASTTADGTQLSILIPSSPGVRRQVASIPLEVTVPLPAALIAGDYVLGGSIPTDVLGPGKPSPSMKDVKDGLLLRVTKGT